MTYTGHVQNGAVVLPSPLPLPDGTAVEVVAKVSDNGSTGPTRSSRLEHYRRIIGAVKDLPADAALNHDHYLYGGPKQFPEARAE